MSRENSYKVAIIGQGYVGFPLAMAAAESGFDVVGIDNNVELVAKLVSKKSPIRDIKDSHLASQTRYRATADMQEINGAEIVVLCLPTPLDEQRLPNNSFLLAGAEDVASHLSPGALVINESTVSPGYTREALGQIFVGFDLAYSPERIDPANKKWNVKNTPKLVAGLSESATTRAVNFYSHFVTSVSICSTVEVAETAKLLENSFRLVNISFINEIAEFCDKMKIDVREVISAASTKPYGFLPFFPSAGVGGHCIPVDPTYLADKAREIGAPSRFIDLANEVNLARPSYFVGVASGLLGFLSGKKILVVGVAYKPDVADIRETPAESLIMLLREAGAKVAWHDDLVGQWHGESSVALSAEYDLAILVNPHTDTDLSALRGVPMIDTRGGF
jgi:UDP-N-acetyl-D-glucosamine dehydrogenase